jgi:hypothetical protein
MTKNDSIFSVQLQLEEAIQLLRLVAAGKRTCLEIEDWLEINYPLEISEIDTINSLLLHAKKDKTNDG